MFFNMFFKNKFSQKFGPWHDVVSSYICKHNLIQQPHKFICMKAKKLYYNYKQDWICIIFANLFVEFWKLIGIDRLNIHQWMLHLKTSKPKFDASIKVQTKSIRWWNVEYIKDTCDNLWNFHVVTIQITKSMLRLTKVILHKWKPYKSQNLYQDEERSNYICEHTMKCIDFYHVKKEWLGHVCV